MRKYLPLLHKKIELNSLAVQKNLTKKNMLRLAQQQGKRLSKTNISKAAKSAAASLLVRSSTITTSASTPVFPQQQTSACFKIVAARTYSTNINNTNNTNTESNSAINNNEQAPGVQPPSQQLPGEYAAAATPVSSNPIVRALKFTGRLVIRGISAYCKMMLLFFAGLATIVIVLVLSFKVQNTIVVKPNTYLKLNLATITLVEAVRTYTCAMAVNYLNSNIIGVLFLKK